MSRSIRNLGWLAGLCHSNTNGTGGVTPSFAIGSVEEIAAVPDSPGTYASGESGPLQYSNCGTPLFAQPGDKIRSITIGPEMDGTPGLPLTDTEGKTGLDPYIRPNVNMAIWAAKTQTGLGNFFGGQPTNRSLLANGLPWALGGTIPCEIEIPEWTRFLYVSVAYRMPDNFGGTYPTLWANKFYVPDRVCSVVLSCDVG